MARKQDEMSLDDELTAAFIEGNSNDLGVEQELEDTPIDTPDEDTPLDENLDEDNDDYQNDGWGDSDEIPGQLAVDVYETVDKLIIKARTAGIERKDLDVSISDNILTISGVLNSGEDEQAIRWHFQECYWGVFSRTIVLPVQVKEDGVEAVLKDGVLTISFEKEKTEAPKRILIN